METIWIKIFSFKINKLSTTDKIFKGKPCDVLNKNILFGDIVYSEPTNIQYKKLVNGEIDRVKISLIDGDGNEILSNFKMSIVCYLYILQDAQINISNAQFLNVVC